MTRFNSERFIAKAKKLHDNKYNYSKLNYHDGKVTILCPIHGPFRQATYAHLRGQKCPKCSIEKTANSRRFTTEEFIRRAKEIHGNFYDYSKVNYINRRTKVKIICPIHGEFLQLPGQHTNKHQGCPKCAIMNISKQRKDNLETFIKKAEAKYGKNSYDYSQVNYKNSKTKIKIICKKCNTIFQQTPSNHLQGSICPICKDKKSKIKKTTKRLNTEKFIKRSREIHGDKYDYSKTDYKNNYTKVKIICPIHGEFLQRPSDHLLGKSCILCGYERMKKAHRFSTEEFIRQSKEVHGKNRYDYSKTNYKNARTKVTIICNVCGREFQQFAEAHKNGNGCPFCNINQNIYNSDITTKTFIKQAKKIYGDKYTYEKTDYKNHRVAVTITCKKYSNFLILPNIFLQSKEHLNYSTISNKDNILEKLGYCSYDKYINKIPLSDHPTKDICGALLVECNRCKRLFAPTKAQINYRNNSINNNSRDGHNFYCSDKCKVLRRSYKKPSDHVYNSKEYKEQIKEVRRNQRNSKRILMAYQIKECGYTYCERCGRKTLPLLHHTIIVAEDPENAKNPNSHMLVCEECHEIIHKYCK